MPSARTQRFPVGAGLKGMLVIMLSLPLLFKTLVSLWGGHLVPFLGGAGAYSLLVLGTVLLRRGVIAEQGAAPRALAFSRQPPLKALAAAVIGVATAGAAFAAAGHSVVMSLLFGIGAAVGAGCYYGLDPRPRPLAISRRGIGSDELAAVLREAYDRLDGINQARQSVRSQEFQQRLSSIVMQSEGILRAIEDDPRDLRRARRFLNVYLDGILRVTRQYVRTHPQAQAYQLEHNYRALLVDMERVCEEQHRKLMQNDVDDLDVQIEVLSKRLKQEGVN